jgi:hypothetical protein
VGAHPRSTTAPAPSSWLAANSATRQRESENSGQHESTLAAGGNAAEGCARQDSAGLKEPPKSRPRTNPWVGVDTVKQQNRLIPYMKQYEDFALGNIRWLPAPTFNSPQEVVLFLLHRHQLPAVQDIVVFSGVNNLVVAGLPGVTADYGQFFFSGAFLRQMGVPEQEEPRWALGRFAEATRRMRRGKKPGGEPDAPETLDPAERVEVAVRNTARGLARLLELAAPTGARVHFVLQPTISWTGKRLSPEEKALIEEKRPGAAAYVGSVPLGPGSVGAHDVRGTAGDRVQGTPGRVPGRQRRARGRPRLALRRPGPSQRRGKPDGHRDLEGRAQPHLTTGRPQHTQGVGRCPSGRSSAGFPRFSGCREGSCPMTAKKGTPHTLSSDTPPR